MKIDKLRCVAPGLSFLNCYTTSFKTLILLDEFMPYRWSEHENVTQQTLELWPHQSLPPRGMAAFVLATFTLITIPLFGLLGTKLLWALLPFLMLAVGGIWFALNRSFQDRSTLETLTISKEQTTLHRTNPRTKDQHWESNTYWVTVEAYEKDGPVPHYVTLKGNGREVEIGAFLSEDERQELFEELTIAFSSARAAT